MHKELNVIPQKKDNHSSQKIGDEIIVVPIVNDIAQMTDLYTLNETAAFIWENLDGLNSLNDILNLMINNFEINETEAKADLFSFMEEINTFVEIKVPHEK